MSPLARCFKCQAAGLPDVHRECDCELPDPRLERQATPPVVSTPLPDQWKGLAEKTRAAAGPGMAELDYASMVALLRDNAAALDKAAELVAIAKILVDHHLDERITSHGKHPAPSACDMCRLAAALTTTTSTDAPPERSPDACALCGHDPSCGYASIIHNNRPTRLCHDNDHSCYVAWTVHGERPKDVEGASNA